MSEYDAYLRTLESVKGRELDSLMSDLADVLQNTDPMDTSLSEKTLDVATDWLQTTFETARKLGGWSSPHMSSTADGEIAFEWWKGERKLTLYLSDRGSEYIKVWGPDIETEMDDGPLNHWSFVAAWLWLQS